MDIFYTSKFERAFKKLDISIKRLAINKEQLFRENYRNPRLKTHKLNWKLEWYYSFSVDYSYRILFEFMDDWNVLFLNIWDHNIYK